LDKSAWVQTQYVRDAAGRIADLIRRGDVALCTMTVLEILSSARNATEYNRDHNRLATLRWLDLSDARKAAELQRELAQHGWHRTPIPDVVIAATAVVHHLTLLHDDSGYEWLAEVADVAHEWVVPRGSGHGKLP
jgi:predicted nucleic acid-binding protein